MTALLHIEATNQLSPEGIADSLSIPLHEAVSRNRSGKLQRVEVFETSVSFVFQRKGTGCVDVIKQYLKLKKLNAPWFITFITPKGKYSTQAANFSVAEPKELLEKRGSCVGSSKAYGSVTGRKSQVVAITYHLSRFENIDAALNFEEKIASRLGHFGEVDGNDVDLRENSITFWIYCSSGEYVSHVLARWTVKENIEATRIAWRERKGSEFTEIEI